MSYYTFYDNTTGRIIAVRSLDTAPPRLESFVEGLYLPDLYYIEKGRPVQFPPKPAGSKGAQYRWDWKTKTWQYDEDLTISFARRFRQQLLGNVDQVNPLWYDSMTQQQKDELASYRQALLDVTDQPDWPVNIIWPAKPVWL